MFCLCSLPLGVSLVGTAVWSCLVIHPVFLCVTHSMTAGDLALRAGSVERTGARAVAESLNAVTALARVPVIDDHLHRHLASPNAGAALLLVGSCRQSPVTALAVDRKRRWNTTPRWRRCLFRSLTCSTFQIGLVELNGLQTRIGNRQCFAGDGITHLELVFGVRAFPNANEKFSDLTPNVAAHLERVTQIRVSTLIERTAQSNPRLHGSQHTVPGYFLNCIFPQGGQAARLSKLYS